jgi:tRNA-splicing ligase RtcB
MGGSPYMLERGYGTERDIVLCEEAGCMQTADATCVSEKAKMRGRDQLGTLGSGNHFLEIQAVTDIYDENTARVFGLARDMVTVMIHCGSRGLGHQTCTDHVRIMMNNLATWGYQLPDRELVYAPVNSPQACDYYAAMSAAANYAWANRHLITHWVRDVWHKTLGNSVTLETVYDVCHNIGKREKHIINEKEHELLVHRKGATRAFGPGRSELPLLYQHTGLPVFVPGTMGTASYVLAGTPESMTIALGSCCHGAGRRWSRIKAKKKVRGSELRSQLASKGIIIESDSDPGLAEEAPLAYKDIEEVITVVTKAGCAQKIARLVPLAVIKGG